MRNQIVLYLLRTGVKPHYKGFNYLVSALEHTMDSLPRIPMLEIYHLVAEEHGVTAKRVERCIRTLVNTLGDDVSKAPSWKYTNGEFIYLCTMRMRMNEEKSVSF